MTSKTSFHVTPRAPKKDSKNGQNESNFVPANVYGLNKDSQAISIDSQAFIKLYEQEGDTGVVYLEGEGFTEEPVLIDEIQTHPANGEVRHVAFKRVDLAEKIEAEIPVEMVGENEVPDATVLLVLDEVTVKALPTDFPESFEVDISKLTEIGQSINISDLDYDRSKVELVLSGETTEESPLVILQEVQEEEVEEEISPEDVEITGGAADEKADAEGDADSKSEDKSGDSQEESDEKTSEE